MYSNILVPTDGSVALRRGGEAAVELAKAIGARSPSVRHRAASGLRRRSGADRGAAGRFRGASRRARRHVLGEAAAKARRPASPSRPRRSKPNGPMRRSSRPRAERARPHRDGLAWAQGRRRARARQRDAEGADPLQDPGAGASLTPSGGRRRARKRMRGGVDGAAPGAAFSL